MVMRGRGEIVRTFKGTISHFNRQTLYRGNADLSGVFFDNTDFGPPPRMPDWDTPAPHYPGFPGQSDSGAPGSGG